MVVNYECMVQTLPDGQLSVPGDSDIKIDLLCR